MAREYAFDINLQGTARVMAVSEQAARDAIMAELDSFDVSAVIQAENGAVIRLTEASVCRDSGKLFEIDGESPETAAPDVEQPCDHPINQARADGKPGLCCASCGVVTLEVEARECGGCRHYFENAGGGCSKHLMAVHRKMKVGFKPEKGTCWELGN